MPPTKHAVLGASSAKRWLHCTPSARLCQQYDRMFGQESTVYAVEGSQAHALCEAKLKKELGLITQEELEEERNKLGNQIPADMERSSDEYVDIIMEKWTRAKNISPDAEIYIEKRVDYSRYVPEGFGTADCIIVSDDCLEVLDYKHGAGVRVDAEGNPQARLYGIGASILLDPLYGFKRVINTIVQPRMDNISSEELTLDELYRWAEEIKPLAQLAFDGAGEFHPGKDTCRFCRVKAICAARWRAMTDRLGGIVPSRDLIPAKEIPGILQVADQVESFLHDVKAHAMARAMAGEKIPGMKLVQNRGRREWINHDMVLACAVKAHIRPDDVFIRKPKSISEIQKIMGKAAFEANFGKALRTKAGNVDLVPVSNPKPEFHPVVQDEEILKDLKED